jgi:hypothetical protein
MQAATGTLDAYKEGEFKQAEACRKESIDMKLHGIFRLGMPNE